MAFWNVSMNTTQLDGLWNNGKPFDWGSNMVIILLHQIFKNILKWMKVLAPL